MRSFEEIQEDIKQANRLDDTEALLRCALELDTFDTPQTAALASSARGFALRLLSDYPAALEHFNRAQAIHEKLGDKSGVASATINSGHVLIDTGDYSAALEHYRRAQTLVEELEDPSGIAIVLGSFGVVYNATGDYDAALEHYRLALAIHEELAERGGIAKLTLNIGTVYFNIGDYPAALENYRRALALFEELGRQRHVASVIGNIGSVYVTTSEYPLALEHYHRALAIHEVLNNRSGVITTTCNIGSTYLSTGDYPSGLDYLHRALNLCEEIGDRSSAAAAMNSIGIAYNRMREFAKALEITQRALSLHEEIGERSKVSLAKCNLVNIYLEMGSIAEAQNLLATMDATQIDNPGVRVPREHHRATIQVLDGNFDGADQTLQRALVDAREHGLRLDVANTHKELRDLALKQNDLARYVEHNNEFLRITEEINGKETTLKLAMQAKQREIDARERETEKHMAVLHSTLPKHIADRVARGELVNDHYDNAAVIFIDIVGFTTLSSTLTSQQVATLLDAVFGICDQACNDCNVTRIKTIGDSYLAIAFDS